MIDEVNGLLLFINPTDSKNRPQMIADEIDIAIALGEEIQNSNEGISFKPWTPEMASTQVKLVDELQFIAFHKPNIVPIKVAILISAWDQIDDGLDISGKIDPELWLKNHLPLFYQFLQCNSDNFAYKIFGVSAQGFDYEKKEKVTDSSHKAPNDRVVIREGNNVSNDITKPIIWVSE
jgi:hypothetical protein